jgi:hypothetical protein
MTAPLKVAICLLQDETVIHRHPARQMFFRGMYNLDYSKLGKLPAIRDLRNLRNLWMKIALLDDCTTRLYTELC